MPAITPSTNAAGRYKLPHQGIVIGGARSTRAGKRVPWGVPMICSVCQLELGIERREDELLLGDFRDWRTRCVSLDRGDPLMCKNMRPTILKMLPDAITLVTTEHTAKDEP